MFSFMTAIKIILLIVLTPKRIINPIPAEIPKIVWVAHSEINPPIKAYGIVLAAISVSFTVPKLKYNKNKISNKTAGTIIANCLLALSLLSNSPAQTTLFLDGIEIFSDTFFLASAIVLPKSLPSMLNPTAIYLLPPSLYIKVGPVI